MKKREKNIDLFKAALVIIMILAHVFQIIGKNNRTFKFLYTYASLITLSGFLFCFRI